MELVDARRYESWTGAAYSVWKNMYVKIHIDIMEENPIQRGELGGVSGVGVAWDWPNGHVNNDNPNQQGTCQLTKNQ